MWRWIIRSIILLFIGLVLTACWAHQPRPQLVTSTKADALAQRVMAAVGDSAWRRLNTVTFTFRGLRYEWSVRQKRVVMGKAEAAIRLDLASQTCHRISEGSPLGQKACQGKFRRWHNDSFWLHPFGKLFDPGVKRALCDVDHDGQVEPWLCIRFSQGGDTPGDTYAIKIGADGRPVAWKMWVDILPIGGLYTQWADWQSLPGGAWFAGTRELSLYSIPIQLISAH